MIEYGGPPLYYGGEDEQRSFDATCRKFNRFLNETAHWRLLSPTDSADEACFELSCPSTRGSSHWDQGPGLGFVGASPRGWLRCTQTTLRSWKPASRRPSARGHRCPRSSGGYVCRTPTHPAGSRCRSGRSTKRRTSPCPQGSWWV